MAPRGSSVGVSSPIRATSHHAVARRLEFEQDESSLQETPAQSGSGQRRGKRSSVYDIPEDGSPAPQTSAVLEESFVQEEITANEDSVAIHDVAGESIAQIGDDTVDGAEAVEDVVDVEGTESTPEPVKEPARRGRKRKNDMSEPVDEESSSAKKPRKRGAAAASASEAQKKTKKPAPAPAASSRRSKRVSDLMEQESSAVDASINTSADASEAPEESEEAPAPTKRRARSLRAKPEAEKGNAVLSKVAKNATAKTKTDNGFKKPPKPAVNPKAKTALKGKAEAKALSEPLQPNSIDAGKLVDVHGHPLSKKAIDEMSTTSVGTRFGRGRHLSVFRELEPEAVARVGRTGRHRVAPIDFWLNDRIEYDPVGEMTSIVKNQHLELERKQYKASSKKGKKSTLAAIEEEEVELDLWEEEDGVLVGNYRDFDPATDVTSQDIIEDSKHISMLLHIIMANNVAEIAWAQKGIQPVDVPDGSFQYTKLASVGTFFNWGVIELRADQMKRTKNSRKMHMVFNVQSGIVEVKVHENEFTVHKGGIWQVPRGMSRFFSSLLPFQSSSIVTTLMSACLFCFRHHASRRPSSRLLSLYASTRVVILHVPVARTQRNSQRRTDVVRASEAAATTLLFCHLQQVASPNCSAACRACCVTFDAVCSRHARLQRGSHLCAA